MKDLNYKFLGRESQTWQKKYFFQEVGRGGNPDSAFMVLLVSGRVRSVESSAALGSAVYAKLVNQYGQTHLSDGPREMVKRLVDIVNAEAAEARQSRTELAAGFLFFKGRRAAAGSVGRLRAGFADRDTLIVTSPLPERARQKGNEGQVSLDLGHTVEGDTKETPAFFIVPSGAMAMGDEHMRKFLWDFVSDELGMRDRAPAGWEHLPCLVGAAADLEAPAACGTKKKRKEKAAASRSRQSAPAGGLLTGSASKRGPRPVGGASQTIEGY